EAAEDVTSLGDPGDRLDPEGMHGEDERRDRRAPFHDGLAIRALPTAVAGRREEAPRHEVEDGRVRSVDEQVQEVIAPRTHSPGRIAHREAEPGDRDVVTHANVAERPPDLRRPE